MAKDVTITLETAKTATLVEDFRQKLQGAQICQPNWQFSRRYTKVPIAFDPELTIERKYLENWKILFDQGEKFALDRTKPLFGPYQSKLDDYISEKSTPCMAIEVRLHNQNPEAADEAHWQLLKFCYFEAEVAVKDPSELPELVICDRLDNILYWRTQGIDILAEFEANGVS